MLTDVQKKAIDDLKNNLNPRFENFYKKHPTGIIKISINNPKKVVRNETDTVLKEARGKVYDVNEEVNALWTDFENGVDKLMKLGVSVGDITEQFFNQFYTVFQKKLTWDIHLPAVVKRVEPAYTIPGYSEFVPEYSAKDDPNFYSESSSMTPAYRPAEVIEHPAVHVPEKIVVVEDERTQTGAVFSDKYEDLKMRVMTNCRSRQKEITQLIKSLESDRESFVNKLQQRIDEKQHQAEGWKSIFYNKADPKKMELLQLAKDYLDYPSQGRLENYNKTRKSFNPDAKTGILINEIDTHIKGILQKSKEYPEFMSQYLNKIDQDFPERVSGKTNTVNSGPQ